MMDKLTTINDILRAKTIDQIQVYETAKDKEGLENPNDVIVNSHLGLFKSICNIIYEFCNDRAEELIVM